MEENKVAELMKPRYLVIAAFPRCWHSVGKIIEQDKDGFFEIWQDEFMDFHYIDSFPHLFKPLSWYEYRKPEEMPEYVRDFVNGIVYKFYGFRNGYMDVTGTETNYGLPPEYSEPATEVEYIQYTKKEVK